MVDASVAVSACASPNGFDQFAGERLVAPPLMWSEARSVLHEALWRGDMSLAQAVRTLETLEGTAVELVAPPRLGSEAWRLASEMGWAKTYDAEYVALAALLGCRLVTLDGRLRRSCERLGFVVTPGELWNL